MTLQLTLPADVELRLRRRAEVAGRDVSDLVSDLIIQFGAPPAPLDRLSGPVQEQFVASGMTDDELADELEQAKHEMRAGRRARSAP